MPVYFYWGEDDFAIEQAIAALRQRILDPQWASFNYDCIASEQPEAIIRGLNQAMTPPFGGGQRLVWLVETTLGQHCSEGLLGELQRTLPVIPTTSVLLLSSRTKPNGRLQSTKLLQQYGKIREFSPIPPWKTEQLVRLVQEMAQDTGLKLTAAAAELLAEAVGNNRRQLQGELDKLRLYAGSAQPLLDDATIAALTATSTHSSLQLAAAIRQGEVAQALGLVAELLSQNEPGLRIVATLVRQFRTWLWVKLLTVDQQLYRQDNRLRLIAQAAEIGNPKRLYFLQQEVEPLSVQQLQQTLPLLLELELSLKQGTDEMTTLQAKIVELCLICRR